MSESLNLVLVLNEKEAAEVQAIVQNGRCPCCGGVLVPHYGCEPVTVAEGVQLCGTCAYFDHHHQDEHVSALVEAAATGRAVWR